MDDSQTRKSEMLIRVDDFGVGHAAVFPALSLAGQKFAVIKVIVEDLQQHGTAQAASGSAMKTSTGAKKAARDELRRQMVAVSETARAMESSIPGISQSFRLPNTNGDQALLNGGRAFVEAATHLESEFTSREMPVDFLAKLSAAIDTFKNACESQNLNREKRVSATAAIDEVVARGMALVRELDAIVRNKFRDDAATLAAWESARHVERPARRKGGASKQPPTSD